MSEAKLPYILPTPKDALRQSEAADTDQPRQLLTRQQLAEVLETTDAKIRRYAESDTSNEYFGGITGLGKGVRYPAEAIPLFREAITLTPALFQKRIVDALAGRREGANGNNGALSLSPLSPPVSQMALLTAQDSDRLIETIRVGFGQMVHETPLQVIAYPDKWLTLKEAREETGLTISEIRSVPSLQTGERGRRRWRRSKLQKLIETMGEKTL